MCVTNRKLKPEEVGLRPDDDEFLDLVILLHPAASPREKEVQIEGRRRAKLERLQDLHSPLRATLKDEPSPARHLPLPDAGPAAPEVRSGEIDEISDRRRLRTEEPNPRADEECAGAVDQNVNAILQRDGMLFE